MLTRQELKERAREQIRGNIWAIFLCNFVIFGISLVTAFIPIASFAAPFIIMPPLSLGIVMVYLDISYGNKPQVSTLFEGFQQLGQSICTFLLYFAIIFGVLIVLMVPAIFIFIKSARSMTYDSYMGVVYIVAVIIGIITYIIELSFLWIYYIMAEYPSLSAIEIIKESHRMMKGHKWEYFVLELSFIPWFLLIICTLGFAAIYVGPYTALTFTNYYHNLKGNDFFKNQQANNKNNTMNPYEDSSSSPLIDHTPVIEEVTPITEEPSPTVEDTASVIEETLPVANESVHISQEAIPVDETPSFSGETSVSVDESSSSGEETTEEDDDDWSWDKLYK